MEQERIHRGDDTLVFHPGGPDPGDRLFHQRGFVPGGFQFDHQPDAALGRVQHFAQGGDPFPRERRGKMGPCVQRLHRGIIGFPDLLVKPRHAPKIGVVQNDQLAVPGLLYVDLGHAGTLTNGPFQRGQGVFGRKGGARPVGHHDHAGLRRGVGDPAQLGFAEYHQGKQGSGDEKAAEKNRLDRALCWRGARPGITAVVMVQGKDRREQRHGPQDAKQHTACGAPLEVVERKCRLTAVGRKFQLAEAPEKKDHTDRQQERGQKEGKHAG